MGATFNTVGSGLQMQWAFIDYRNYPDGPSGFIMEVGGIWPITLGNFGGCLVTWTADAILVRTRKRTLSPPLSLTIKPALALLHCMGW
jgi:hypothetical protein